MANGGKTIDKSTVMSIGVVILIIGAVFSWGVMYNKVNALESRFERNNSNQRITTLETQYSSIEARLSKQSEQLSEVLSIIREK